MPAEINKEENSLTLSVPVGGGPRKDVELLKRSLHPSLTFAQRQVGISNNTAETYAAITDRILKDEAWKPRRVFVTSPAKGDGKTTTALNLAWAFSQQKKRVLLVELEFTKPRFLALLGDLRIRYGIDGALHGSTKPEDSVFSLGTNGLEVGAVRDPLDKRGIKRREPQLAEYIEWASSHYDWLVLDCPPVLSPHWDEWFASHADPALLVVRDHETSVQHIRKAAQRLGSHLKATVLNATDLQKGDASHALHIAKINSVA